VTSFAITGDLKVTFAKIIILFQVRAELPDEQPPAGQAESSKSSMYFDGSMKSRQLLPIPGTAGDVVRARSAKFVLKLRLPEIAMT
jgi:hypothetical protein